MKKLDLDVLEMLAAVADTGSFVRGAESVRRSPSAVSMQIKALEEALGKPLFARSTRNVAITAEGKTLLDYGRRMLAMREEAWASVVRPEMKGRVTIGVPDDYASSLLPQVLAKFAVAHPRVEIRVIGLPSSELVPLLKDNTLDLACFTKTRGIAGEFIRANGVGRVARKKSVERAPAFDCRFRAWQYCTCPCHQRAPTGKYQIPDVLRKPEFVGPYQYGRSRARDSASCTVQRTGSPRSVIAERGAAAAE